jgi:hypothetical protein
MNTIFETESVTDQDQTAEDTESTSLPHISDFFEARHQLILESREAARPNETVYRVQGAKQDPELPVTSTSVLEDALYWFISAPALVYVVYLIVGF